MFQRKSLKTWALLFCGLVAAGGAWALKTDKNEPINVRADHGDFMGDPNNNSNGTGIYTGHVVITQGSIQLTADKAVLHIVNNELDTADVTGEPATFQQQPDNGEVMHGTAREITYDASDNEIVLITDARLTQAVTQDLTDTSKSPVVSSPRAAPGERLITADRIRYDTDTQHVIAKGRNEEDRVHITFPPKTRPPLPSTAPGSKSSSPGISPAAASATAVAPHRPAPATVSSSPPPPAAATQPGGPA